MLPTQCQLEKSDWTYYLGVGILRLMERHNIAMTFAANLDAIMREREIDASRLARDAGMNRTGVYDILSGKSQNPRLDTLAKLAKALQVSPAALLADRPVSELENQLHNIMAQLSPVERSRLILTAQAWASHGLMPAPEQ